MVGKHNRIREDAMVIVIEESSIFETFIFSTLLKLENRY